MKIAILGAGVYGTALGGVLAENGYDIDYYDPAREPERLVDAVQGTKAIILCVPSEVATRLLPHLPKDKFLIVATKGFLTDAPFEEFKDWAVLSGAGFADDIKNGQHAILTTTDERAQELFTRSSLGTELTNDRLGVLMCGALKNVYALWAGYCILKPDTPAHEKYLKDAADEMRAILLANGANPMTVDLSCGAADLRLTCGPGSRNYAYGMKLAQDAKVKSNVTVEGLTVLGRIKRGEIKLPGNLPYLESLMRENDKWG